MNQCRKGKVRDLIMNNLNNGQKSSFAVSPKMSFSTCISGEDRWAIILAGGDGSRLLSLTRKIAGDDRPKQFCPIINGKTLLDETRRCVALALSPEKTMFVLTQKHEPYYKDALDGVPPANLIVQPKNAGTTSAILYSLLCLEQINPQASAAFFPSDHYFSDDRVFMSEVEFAFAAASQQPDSIILLGIEPESPDEEYGWIEPEPETSINKTFNYRRVRRFWEKPSPVLARELMERGCLWNSFVMVGAVSAYLKMIRLATSKLYTKFAAIKSNLSTPAEKYAVQALYADLPDSNFSREVLQTRATDLTVVPVGGSKWSDLGSPHRVFSTLSDLGSTSLIKREPTANLMKLPEGFYERARISGSEAV
jgi:mannose-1-phosphate guanylyltransferase